jgi:hypothetical protein
MLLAKARRRKEAEKDNDLRKKIFSVLTMKLKEIGKKSKKGNVKQTTKPTESEVEKEFRRQKEIERDGMSNFQVVEKEWSSNPSFQKNVSYGALLFIWFGSVSFIQHSIAMSKHLSEPQIMVQIPDPEFPGENRRKIVDDFREAYWWLRDNTPKESRVSSSTLIITFLTFLSLFCFLFFSFSFSLCPQCQCLSSDVDIMFISLSLSLSPPSPSLLLRSSSHDNQGHGMVGLRLPNQRHSRENDAGGW